jgi:hypothetical protein
MANTMKLVNKARPANKKLSVKQFQKKFKVRFDMKDDAIDLRTMSENYENGIVPLDDIAEAIAVLMGPTVNSPYTEYDPSDPNTLSPRFAYVKWHELYLMPIFQRDVITNHIRKIFRAYDPSCVIVPCAIKITIEGKVYYCIWDGHHTLQVCKLKNYQKFPIWYIDVDAIPQEEIEKAGFGNTANSRIRYGIYKAGNNMRNINGRIKSPLSAYDNFMIGVETGDQDFVAMMNIYNKYGVVPKRHNVGAYAMSQPKSAEECYNLLDSHGNKGRFLDRALAFHTKNWKSPITLEVFRPLAFLYQRAETQGFVLDAKFDDELANLLIKQYGDSETVQEKIKESYWYALTNNLGKGNVLQHDKQRVMNGFINLYNQKIGRLIMPTADYAWIV